MLLFIVSVLGELSGRLLRRATKQGRSATALSLFCITAFVVFRVRFFGVFGILYRYYYLALEANDKHTTHRARIPN
jgi:hypothetical protein